MQRRRLKGTLILGGLAIVFGLLSFLGALPSLFSHEAYQQQIIAAAQVGILWQLPAFDWPWARLIEVVLGGWLLLSGSWACMGKRLGRVAFVTWAWARVGWNMLYSAALWMTNGELPVIYVGSFIFGLPLPLVAMWYFSRPHVRATFAGG